MKEEKTIGWVSRRESGKYFKRNRRVELVEERKKQKRREENRRDEHSFWVKRSKWNKEKRQTKIDYSIRNIEVYSTSAECFQIDW